MKRWIIRSFFIELLLLSLAGWAASGSYCGVINYTTSYGNTYLLQTYRGRIEVGRFSTPWRPGPSCLWNTLRQLQWWPSKNEQRLTYYWLGFGFERDPFTASVPYWFLTIIALPALWLACRKTRSRINPSKSFPVEPSNPTAEQDDKAE